MTPVVLLLHGHGVPPIHHDGLSVLLAPLARRHVGVRIVTPVPLGHDQDRLRDVPCLYVRVRTTPRTSPIPPAITIRVPVHAALERVVVEVFVLHHGHVRLGQ